MAGNPTITVDFVANTKKLKDGFDDAGSKSGGLGSKIKSAALPAAAALGLLAAGGKKAIDASSSLHEQMSASEVVFGSSASSVQDWAKTGAKAFGLSTTESLKAANAYGNMFSTIGLGAGDTKDMSQAMVQLAGDMGSFHDQDPSEMLDKLRSGLSGEAEPLRQFGVLISEAAVNQEAYADGIAKQGSKLTEAQKVQARYALIMKQTSKAQGDFVRTGDSVANQQRTTAAETANLTAEMGTALLPATQAVQQIMLKLLGVFGEHKTLMTVMIALVGGLALAVVAINAAMALATAATTAWTAVQWLLNTALFANPIGLVVLAVVALGAAVVIAYKKSDKFREIVDAAFNAVWDIAKKLFNWLKSNWPLLLAILVGPIGIAVLVIVRHWDTIRDTVTSAVAAVKGVVVNAWNAVRDATVNAWNAVTGAITDTVADVKRLLGAIATWVTGFASGALTAAVNRVKAIWDNIADGARAAVEGVKDAFNGVIGWLGGLVGRVRSAADSIASAFKAPINSMLSAWNSLSFTIPKVTIPSKTILGKKIGGGSFGGQTISFPNVSLLAKGGVIATPTLAMIGEGQGREIVTPENLLRQIVGERNVQVRVFIGDRELTHIVRTEIVDSNTGLARGLLAGGAG